MQQLVVHAKVEIIKRIVFSFLVNLTLVNNHSPKFHVIHKEPVYKLCIDFIRGLVDICPFQLITIAVLLLNIFYGIFCHADLCVCYTCTSQKHVGMTVMHHVGAFITVDVECLIHCICFLFILYSFSSAVHYEVHGSASHHAC